MTAIQLANKYGLTREAIYIRLRTIPNWKQVAKRMREKSKSKRLNKYKDILPEIEKLASEGHSMSSISKELGISYDHTKKLLKLTKYDNSYKALKQKYQKIRHLYSKGWSRKRLMEEFNYSYIHIGRILRRDTTIDKK